LAFFPADEIQGDLKDLKLYLPEEAREVTEWFENNTHMVG
jgi:hypothetical protein